MSIKDKDVSEKSFQQRFVDELKCFKWEAPDSLDGNRQSVTVDDLILNWRGELNRLNADQLEGVVLSDNEFSQVMSKVNQISNSYEAAKILSIEESKGKIDGIYRDDHPNVTRKQITLTIFKKAEVRGGDSKYQIAREVQTSNGNRFDLVLLINGLPLINIEQKRTDKSLDEAYNQFIRYYRDGEYTNNFMVFSQMMVMTTEIETRYFATPKSIEDFNKSFVFHWTDKMNKPVNQWQKVIEHFLMIPMAHQMVGDYLVIDEAREQENRRHMLMRPYQVYALQAVEGAAFGWDNPTKKPHGGFVWHTTGSGKTITSFKTALFLSTRAGFDKVIFLVDRKELDKTTAENFKAYAAYEPVDVNDTNSTAQLKKQLYMKKSGIVVTTTYKLNALVKDLEIAHDDTLKAKRIVFIIDEAHRTTMGQMMETIKKYFKKHGLFYGFTGTPLFDENKTKGRINEKSEVIDTTEKLFGPRIHQYTIDEAIKDRNVLGFNIDYINTGEFIGYESLRDALIEKIKEENPDKAVRDIEHQVYEMSDLQVEENAMKYKLFIYQDETHIPRVVSEILSNWDRQSQNRAFNAILTVAYKKRVLAYFNEFQKQLKEQNKQLNITMSFSFSSENTEERVTNDVVELMFKHYGSFTGIEFIIGDKKRGEDAYFDDIVERGKRGGSGRNAKNIDLIIVADQFLTGYDSKRLNTLYVDRKLELQHLIQAYSRTNRVLDKTKEFGTVINFQYPKITEQLVQKALVLYGSGGSSSKVIVDKYVIAVQKLHDEVTDLISALSDPTDWMLIKDDEEALKQFKMAFLSANDQMNKVQQYYEFEWDDLSFGITEHKWMQYVGAYKNLFKQDQADIEEVIIRPLPGRIKLQGTQVIDAPHIIKLIGDKTNVSNGVQTVDSETLRLIYEEIQELSNMGEDEESQLLRIFVDSELIEGKVSSDVTFDEAFEIWKQKKQKNVVIEFAKQWGIEEALLLKSVKAFAKNTSGKIPYLDDILQNASYEKSFNKSAKNKLKHRIQLTKVLPKWMEEVVYIRGNIIQEIQKDNETVSSSLVFDNKPLYENEVVYHFHDKIRNEEADDY